MFYLSRNKSKHIAFPYLPVIWAVSRAIQTHTDRIPAPFYCEGREVTRLFTTWTWCRTHRGHNSINVSMWEVTAVSQVSRYWCYLFKFINTESHRVPCSIGWLLYRSIQKIRRITHECPHFSSISKMLAAPPAPVAYGGRVTNLRPSVVKVQQGAFRPKVLCYGPGARTKIPLFAGIRHMWPLRQKQADGCVLTNPLPHLSIDFHEQYTKRSFEVSILKIRL